MHVLQPKHTKLKPDEVKELIDKYSISLSPLPKIKSTDPACSDGCQTGEILKIVRKEGDKTITYFRVVV